MPITMLFYHLQAEPFLYRSDEKPFTKIRVYRALINNVKITLLKGKFIFGLVIFLFEKRVILKNMRSSLI